MNLDFSPGGGGNNTDCSFSPRQAYFVVIYCVNLKDLFYIYFLGGGGGGVWTSLTPLDPLVNGYNNLCIAFRGSNRQTMLERCMFMQTEDNEDGRLLYVDNFT